MISGEKHRATMGNVLRALHDWPVQDSSEWFQQELDQQV
jgi:hypothetical protein